MNNCGGYWISVYLSDIMSEDEKQTYYTDLVANNVHADI